MNRVAFYLGLILSVSLFFQCTEIDQETKKWAQADSILKHIQPPEFPDQTFNIKDYGAVGDGSTMNTGAIKAAINACNKAGGGKVLVPEGKYLTGPIHLKSNINLHVDQNAVLLFSTHPDDYLPTVLTRWEGVDLYNYSPFIYAYEKENIAITGKGTLHGQATKDNWWIWKGRTEYGWEEGMPSQSDSSGRPTLMSYEQNQTPIDQRKMGKGHYLRPQFINLYKCSNILISDITIKDSPFWIVHPLMSENITVRNIHVNSHGPNNDGCNPESCKNVLIENCFFNTGDDCIAIKSGRNNDGRKWDIPSQNIIVRDCKMENGHGGVVMGSEISGGCNNIFVENCVMDSPELERAIRIKTNSKRGGVVEDLYVRNVEVGQVAEAAVKINCSYESSEGKGNYLPTVRNIYINNMTCQTTERALYLRGIENKDCVYDIYIRNTRFKTVEKENLIKDVRGIHLENVYQNGEKMEL